MPVFGLWRIIVQKHDHVGELEEHLGSPVTLGPCLSQACFFLKNGAGSNMGDV